MKFNEKLKSLRIKNNETQIDLANYLNITFQSVSKWENGVCLPNIEMIKEIANHYNVTLDSLLLDFEDAKENKNEEKDDVDIKKYHPTINEESYFCVFLDKGKYPSIYAKGRYRTANYIPQCPSSNKESYVIAVNEHGKIIYMAKSTGYGYGSPCDKFYHQSDVIEPKDIDCFYLLPTYSPYGDKTKHYMDWEFIIPHNGFVIIIAEKSLEFKTIFSRHQLSNDYESKKGYFDDLTLKVENDELIVSYKENNKNKLKNSISKDVIEELFKEYIINNKDEIIKMLKDEFLEKIDEAYDTAIDAIDIANEAMDLAQDALDTVEESNE